MGMKGIFFAIVLLIPRIGQAMDEPPASPLFSLPQDLILRISHEVCPSNEDLFSTCKVLNTVGETYFAQKYEPFKKITWAEIPFASDNQRLKFTLRVVNAARLYYTLSGVNMERILSQTIVTYEPRRNSNTKQLSQLAEQLAMEIEGVINETRFLKINWWGNLHPLSHLFLWVKDYAEGIFQIHRGFSSQAKVSITEHFPSIKGPIESLVEYSRSVEALLENKDYSESGEVAVHYLFIHLLFGRLDYHKLPESIRNCEENKNLFIFNPGGTFFSKYCCFPRCIPEKLKLSQNPLYESIYGPSWESKRWQIDENFRLRTIKTEFLMSPTKMDVDDNPLEF